MSKVHDTALKSAVAYYRCSSPQQELSVGEQRKEVEAYAARKGYRIIREYTDEGKSASKNQDKRVAFNKMIADSKAMDFAAVVCYDAARFTRFDNISVAGGMPKDILRTNGVVLDTVKEGAFDLTTPAGRWMDMAYTEANRGAALNLSLDSIRGRQAVVALGYWPNGVVPYGYDKRYTDGVRTIEVRRHEKFAKGRNWHCRLVRNEDEANIVREVFDLFVNRLWSRRQIAMHLTGRKIPPPRGQHGRSNGAWDADNVRNVLREKAYVGFAVLGGRRRAKVAHNRVTVTEKAGSCPVIVDDASVWHRAQEIARGRKESKAKPQTKRGGLFSGFLYCGHCGYRLNKREQGKGVKYMCTSAGQRPHLGCKYWAAFEADLTPRLVAWLREAVDAEVIKALQEKPDGADGRTSDEALLAGQVESLQTRLANAQESALLAPPAVRESVWAKVAEMAEELERARQSLALVKAVRNAPELKDFGEWWKTQEGVMEFFARQAEDGRPLMFVPSEFTEQQKADLRDGGMDDEDIGGIACVEEVRPDTDRLRALLSRLEFKARIFWGKNDSRKDRADIEYPVTDVKIEATVKLTDEFLVADSDGTVGDKRLVIQRVFSMAG